MANLGNPKPNRLPWLIVAGGFVLFSGCCGIAIFTTLLYPTFREQILTTGVFGGLPIATSQEFPTLIATIEQPVPSEPSQTITPQIAGPTDEIALNVDFGGIQFYLDPQLAMKAIPESVPATEEDADSAFPGSVHPEYVQFNLQNYPLLDTFHKPYLIVFPLNKYTALDPVAAQIVLNLQTVLKDKPAQADSLPFLPRWPAGQFLTAQIKYLGFNQGSGVRFLTQYGQATWPINNHDMFYTFQGITDDSKWYIAAVLPASHPQLPETGDSVPFSELDSPERSYEMYLNAMEDLLNTQADDSFTPALTLLDALVQSIHIVNSP